MYYVWSVCVSLYGHTKHLLALMGEPISRIMSVLGLENPTDDVLNILGRIHNTEMYSKNIYYTKKNWVRQKYFHFFLLWIYIYHNRQTYFEIQNQFKESFLKMEQYNKKWIAIWMWFEYIDILTFIGIFNKWLYFFLHWMVVALRIFLVWSVVLWKLDN